MTSYETIYQMVEQHLKPSRFVHSVGVSDMASMLSRRFLQDSLCGKIAGIFHDYCRYQREEELLLVSKNVPDVQAEEKACPMLLHGLSAALVFKEHFPEFDERYYLAMRHHTLGSKNMGPLGACVYIADYAEVGRTHISTQDRQELLSLPSLEKMVLWILAKEERYRSQKGLSLAGITQELKAYLEEGGCF